MAACGLQPGKKTSLDGRSLPVAGSQRKNSEPFSVEANTRTMANFAAAMMRALAELDFEEFALQRKFQLRVGLCSGPVIAGVVGAQKPLYDIWGNTVNVASRMEYLGHCSKIQCPAETANYLTNESIKCTFRDVIYVKGKGNMRTYFVDLTDDMYVETVDKTIPEAVETTSIDNVTITTENPEVPFPEELSVTQLADPDRWSFMSTKETSSDELTIKNDASETCCNCSSSSSDGTAINGALDNLDAAIGAYDSVQNTVSSASSVQIIVHDPPPDDRVLDVPGIQAKKDSGYGSQGILKIDNVSLSVCLTSVQFFNSFSF